MAIDVNALTTHIVVGTTFSNVASNLVATRFVIISTFNPIDVNAVGTHIVVITTFATLLQIHCVHTM